MPLQVLGLVFLSFDLFSAVFYIISHAYGFARLRKILEIKRWVWMVKDVKIELKNMSETANDVLNEIFSQKSILLV